MKAKDIERQKPKAQKDENLVLPKEQVENADLYKPVLNKIMTTPEEYVKYNFVALLTEKIIVNIEKLMLPRKILSIIVFCKAQRNAHQT